LWGLTGTVLNPGLGAFGFLPGTGDGAEFFRGFAWTVHLDMKPNPFAAHPDRVVQHGIPNRVGGNEIKTDFIGIYIENCNAYHLSS